MSEPIKKFVDNFLDHSQNHDDVKEKTQNVRERVLNELKQFSAETGTDLYLDNPAQTKFKVNEFFEWSDRKPNGMNIAAFTRFFRYLRNHQDYEGDRVRYSILAVKELQRSYDGKKDTLQRIEDSKLSFEDKEKLIRAARSFDEKSIHREVMLRLIMEAGLRRVELLALKPPHIVFDSENNPVTIEILEKRKQGEGDIEKTEPRSVAASLETRVKIKELMEQESRKDDESIIWGRASYQVPQNWLNEIVDRASIEKSNIKIRDLRRNVIVELIQKDIKQYRIAEYFGAKSAVNKDVVEKYSSETPSSPPLAENKRLF